MNKTNTPHDGEDLGVRLRAVRECAGKSQRALARQTGVPNSTISLIESGKMNPSVGALRRILDGIPISLSEFFAFQPEPERTNFYAAEDLTEIGKGKLSAAGRLKSFWPANDDPARDLRHQRGHRSGHVRPPGRGRRHCHLRPGRDNCRFGTQGAGSRRCLLLRQPRTASVQAGRPGQMRSDQRMHAA